MDGASTLETISSPAKLAVKFDAKFDAEIDVNRDTTATTGASGRDDGKSASSVRVLIATAIGSAIAVASVRQRAKLLCKLFRRDDKFLTVEREPRRCCPINAKINLPAPRVQRRY